MENYGPQVTLTPVGPQIKQPYNWSGKTLLSSESNHFISVLSCGFFSFVHFLGMQAGAGLSRRNWPTLIGRGCDLEGRRAVSHFLQYRLLMLLCYGLLICAFPAFLQRIFILLLLEYKAMEMQVDFNFLLTTFLGILDAELAVHWLKFLRA